MGAFSRLTSRAAGGAAAALAEAPRIAAPKVVTLPSNGWASDWPGRPTAAVPVGLRLLSLADREFARNEASRIACQLHPEERDEKNWIDCFNDTLMRLYVARGTCQPDDVSRPFWDVADENVKLALSEVGVEHLWEAYDAFRVGEDPLETEATDAELAELADVLLDGEVWGRLELADADRARRLLRAARDLMARA